MKTKEDFIKSMVNIEYIEDEGVYGHYPFQLFSETKNGDFEINSLALGGDVKSCYLRFLEYKNEGSKRIYLSLDFPQGGDIENDFVAILSFENDNLDLIALPYRTEDGKILDIITNSTHLDLIESQLRNFM